jgi:hypothetical protein
MTIYVSICQCKISRYIYELMYMSVYLLEKEYLCRQTKSVYLTICQNQNICCHVWLSDYLLEQGHMYSCLSVCLTISQSKNIDSYCMSICPTIVSTQIYLHLI